jgi:hypothetical protein
VRTPHPRSIPLRTAGQIAVGVGAAATVAGVVLTALCYGDAFGDVEYANEANAGAQHGWSDARVARTQSICDAGGGLLIAGSPVAGAGAAAWYYGGQQVTDPPFANGTPVFSYAPAPGGGQALATWRF